MIKKLTLIIILSSGLIACSQNFYNKKLMKAIENNDTYKVSSILEKQKVNINYISKLYDYEARTPLTLASYKRNYEIVKLLVDKGAGVNIKDGGNHTALIEASKRGYFEIVKYLVENGADINAYGQDYERDIYTKTALMIVSERGNFDMVKYLVENGADINAFNDFVGKTALMYAYTMGYSQIVKYLVENGADINAKDDNDKTALIYAVKNGYLRIVAYSIENGIDINAKYDYKDKYYKGVTILMIASSLGELEIVKYLIKKGADINIESDNGLTALEFVRYERGYEYGKIREILSKEWLNKNYPNEEENNDYRI